MLNMFFCVSLPKICSSRQCDGMPSRLNGSLNEMLRTPKSNEHSHPGFKKLEQNCSHHHPVSTGPAHRRFDIQARARRTDLGWSLRITAHLLPKVRLRLRPQSRGCTLNGLTCVCSTGRHAKVLKQTPRLARPPAPQVLFANYKDGRPTGLRLPRWCF